ncbi:MAG: hypothetical protein GEU28_03770 [Dehalococcoidia bacterium]|nr:hypothetical protein [Dehalococcoidia bacterium]
MATVGAVGGKVTQRPKRIDHVSMAVRDLDAQIGIFKERYGMEVARRWHSHDGEFKGATMKFPEGGLEFELMSPINEDGFVARFLRDRGPGLHHLTFEVENAYEWADHLRANGIEPLYGVREAHGWRETFVHPRDGGGALLQFYQETEEYRASDHADHGHEDG